MGRRAHRWVGEIEPDPGQECLKVRPKESGLPWGRPMTSSYKAQSCCHSAGWSRGAGQASSHCTLTVTQGAAQMRKPRPGGARPQSWGRPQARPPPAPGTSDDGARGEDGLAEGSEHGLRPLAPGPALAEAGRPRGPCPAGGPRRSRSPARASQGPEQRSGQPGP